MTFPKNTTKRSNILELNFTNSRYFHRLFYGDVWNVKKMNYYALNLSSTLRVRYVMTYGSYQIQKFCLKNMMHFTLRNWLDQKITNFRKTQTYPTSLTGIQRNENTLLSPTNIFSVYRKEILRTYHAIYICSILTELWSQACYHCIYSSEVHQWPIYQSKS